MICGKTIYKSKTEAAKVLKGKNADRRPGQSVNRLSTVYFCTDCQGYHVASKCLKRTKKHKNPEDIQSRQHQSKKHKDPNQGVLIIRNYTGKPL